MVTNEYDGSVQHLADLVLSEIRNVLGTINTNSVWQLVNAIMEANRIVLCAGGRMGIVSSTFAMRLAHLGFQCHMFDEPTTPGVGEDDLLIFSSGSGETQTIYDVLVLAKEAGVRIVATGRSDFPNQVNNSLGFPGIFRGALDVRASAITDEMCIAASLELAACARDRGINEEYLIPTMDDWEVYPRIAVAVGMKAFEQGLAATPLTRDELFRTAEDIIKRSREESQTLMREGFIPPPDPA